MALQFDEYFIVTGGADGRVRVFETGSGRLVRDWYGNVGGGGYGGGYGGVSGGYGYDVLSDADTATGMTNIPTLRYENVWKVVFGGSLWGATATGNGMMMDLSKGKGNIRDVQDDGDGRFGERKRGRGRDICAVMCQKPGGRTVVEIWRMSPDMNIARAPERDGEDEQKGEESET